MVDDLRRTLGTAEGHPRGAARRTNQLTGLTSTDAMQPANISSSTLASMLSAASIATICVRGGRSFLSLHETSHAEKRPSASREGLRDGSRSPRPERRAVIPE